MYEYGIERFNELPRIVGPLQDLVNRFCDDTDTLGLICAYERYIQEELNISECDADMIIAEQQQTGILPSTNTLLADRTEAMDGYRMAVCKTVIPYKSAICSVAEYELWLPNAFELIVPSDGENRHAPDICLRTNGMTDEACEIGDCPVKYIRQQAEAVQYLDFSTPDYAKWPEKMCRSVHKLLSCARDKSIITPIERNKYRAEYMKRYWEAFPDTV
jgi:hypothetical protein